MEHSLLHALQLSGSALALAGGFLMLGFVFPSLRGSARAGAPPLFAAQLEASVTRWTFRGAAVAVVAALLNFVVDVAEIDGRSSFGGVDLGAVWRFATITTVGRLSLLRLGAQVFTAAATLLPGRRKWGAVLAGALTAAVGESLICHAAALPSGRGWAIATQLSHVLAASFWVGVLGHLLLARGALISATDDRSIALLAQIIRRFSPVALTSAGLLAVSGLVLSIRYLWTPAAVFISAYGLTLLVKLALLVPLLYAGYVNYRVILPGLRRASAAAMPEARRTLLERFGRALELEVTAGVLVLTMAGILASVSPPEEWGTVCLKARQVKALASPHLPRTKLEDLSASYGAPERTLADRYYAEFTHNWSGVMVCVLGCGWLLQSLGGRLGRWAERGWPLLLMPLPLFIAAAADPEIWVLRKVTLAQALQDPQVVEHHLGALLALILVAFGWLDRRRPLKERPLGYTLPAVVIVGSLLLLGHAHSNFSQTQELTNLVNVQHAIFGAFGLFAGVVRWLSLRGLIPERPARWVWPVLIIGLGLFMAFCYRETI
jgi:putative copper export protein